MTRRVNQFSPRWWKTERIQHSQDLNPVTKYPDGMGGGTGKGLELWSSTNDYAKNDVVFFNSPDVKGIFVANEAIPASGFLNIGIDGPTWSVVGDEFASIPNWYAMEWPANSVVVRSGAIRRAIANTSASWVDSEWDNLTPAPAAVDTDLLFQDHDASKSYKKDQVVVKTGKLYRARTNIGALPFSTSDWEEVSPSTAAGLTEVQIFDFDTIDTYKANELCVMNDKLYRAINNTGPGTFDTSDWKEVSAASATVTTVADFSTSKTYVTNELTIHSGRLYRATKDVAAGAFSLSNFAPADATGIVDAFDPTQSYNKGEIVRHQASFFMAAVNVPAGPFNLSTAQWAYIGGGTVTTTDWNNTLFYPFGSTVIKDKAVYRSKANQMAGAWVDNLWEPIASLHGRLPAFSGVETYYKDMVVTYNGFAWRCTVVTAAASTMPEGNPSWEKLFSLSLNPNILPYTTNAKYNSGDVVVAEGRLIRANKAIASAPAVFTPADWEAMSQLSLAAWNSGKCSFAGDTFIDNGVLYRCKVTNRGAWSLANFDQIGQIDQLKQYDPTKKYVLDQLVIRNGQILRCESDVSSVGYDDDDWDFTGHLLGVQPFYNYKDYEKYDIVMHLGVMWRTNSTKAAANFDYSGWERVSGTPAIGDFIPDFPYDPGDIIKVGNKLFINNEGVRRLTILMTDWAQFGQMRGLWDTTQVYLAEDIVINGNNIYRANGNIPANTAFVQGAGTKEWTRLAPSDPPSAPDFAPMQAYKKDSLVIRGGKLYRSKADFTATASWDDANWQALVAEAAASVPDFVLAKDYVLNQVVADSGVLYRTRNALTAAQANKLPSADSTNWQAVSLTYIHVPDHSATGTYSLNECVINPADNRMYRAKVKITTGRDFADADWQLIADRLPNVIRWDTVTAANNVWFLGDFIQKENAVYVATKNQQTGTLVWPTADVRQLTIATNFYGYATDTDYALPVGAIFIATDGTVMQTKKSVRTNTVDETALKILSTTNIGDWRGTGYNFFEGAIVYYRGATYRALRPSQNKNPELSPADWELMTDSRSWFTFWSSSKNYVSGEIVVRSNQLYLATADNAAGTFESGSWQLVSGSQAKVKEWNTTQANNTWLVGDFIRRYGNVYVAETASAAGGEATWPNAKLKQLNVEPYFLGSENDALNRSVKLGDMFISNQGHICRYIVDGDPTTFLGMYYDIINFDMTALAPWVSDEYPAGYMVTHKNKIWKAVVAATISAEPGVPLNAWREVAPSRVVADNFSADREYSKNELVVNGGKLYRAKDIIGPAAWDEVNFEALGGSGGIAAWESTKDYAIGTEVRWDETTYKATEAIAQGGLAPDVNGKWAAVNKASAIAKLVPGETVVVGALRMYNNLGLMANAAHTVASPVDNTELEKWDLAIGKMGNATYTAKTYIGSGTAIDFTVTANWTKAGSIVLPSTDNFLFWKNKGARFYLNGQPLAAAAVSFVEKGFTINGHYVESGDVVSVEF